MNNRIKLISVFFFGSIASLYGQNDFRDGFLLTLRQDTINGQINYRSDAKNYKSCIFKDEFGEITEYQFNEILGFQYRNDKFFLSQIIDSSFVVVLVSGKLTLYKSENKFHIKKGNSIFDLETQIQEEKIEGYETIFETKDNSKWKGIVSYLINDCLDKQDNFLLNSTLKEKTLVKLVLDYNICSGQDYHEYKSQRKWFKLGFGIALGVSKSEIHIKNTIRSFSYLADSYESIDPSYGVVFSINLPRFSKKFSFQAEVNYMKSYFSELVISNGIPFEYHDTFITLNKLSTPLSAKYSFKEKKNSLFIQGGVHFIKHLNSNTTLYTERVAQEIVRSSESNAFEIESSQIGYWGGFGVSYKFTKMEASISLRYFQMSPIEKNFGFTANGNSNFTSQNNQLSLNLILITN